MGVVADVQTYLADQGLVDGATGWASVRRRVHDGQNQIVVITEDGGSAPQIGTAAGIGDNALRDPAVQVRTRGEPWDGDGSEAKAQAIYDALHGLLDTTLDATTYIRVVAQTSGPVFAGFDDQGRPEHTVSFRLMRAQPAPT